MGKDKEESVKETEKAHGINEFLAEHDVQYHKLTVRDLLRRAQRVLQSAYYYCAYIL